MVQSAAQCPLSHACALDLLLFKGKCCLTHYFSSQFLEAGKSECVDFVVFLICFVGFLLDYLFIFCLIDIFQAEMTRLFIVVLK